MQTQNPNENQIKAIVFDMGGILNKIKFNKFYKKQFKNYNFNQKELKYFKKWETHLRKKLDKSKISLQEYFQILNEKIKNINPNHQIINQKEYIENLKEFTIWDEKTIKFCKHLKSQNKYKLFIFSNNSELFITEQIKKQFQKIFQNQYYSFEQKLRKPDPNSYQNLIENLKNQNIQPKQTLFIDDKPENLIPAKKLQINTIHYQNLNQLQLDLQNFNIK